jgi:RimJ/RimL family protein N-acetyltransferase
MLVLGTPGLRLRDLVTDDWSLVLALAQDRAVTRFQTSLPRPTETDARQWVEEAIRHNGREPRRAYNLAIVLDEAAVGWIGAGRAEEHGLDAYEVGYALLPSAWGRGAMTEALIAVVAFVLDDLGGERVVGVCSSVNPRLGHGHGAGRVPARRPTDVRHRRRGRAPLRGRGRGPARRRPPEAVGPPATTAPAAGRCRPRRARSSPRAGARR